jgi:FtsH-binding integral membrane protein
MLANSWLVYVAMIGSIATLVVLAFSKDLAKRVPHNYAMLALFTGFESYMVGCVCLMYDPNIVAIAAFMTLALTVALTAYAWLTKEDFTIQMGTAINLCMCLILFSFMSMFIQARFFEILLATFGVFVYGLFIIIDT